MELVDAIDIRGAGYITIGYVTTHPKAVHPMALTNAEKQARWRNRHMVVLTEDAATIAEKLIDMADQAKLKRIAKYVNDHLKHPDRGPMERAVALGMTGYTRRARRPTEPQHSAQAGAGRKIGVRLAR